MFQKTIIIGYLGKEPEMRYTPSGQAVTNFNVATSRKYNAPSGEKISETTWFRVSTWGKTAEACNQFLHKGSMVYVEGRLLSDISTGGPKLFNRQDGSVGSNFEISASEVRFLTSKNGNGSEAQAEPATAASTEDDGVTF